MQELPFSFYGTGKFKPLVFTHQLLEQKEKAIIFAFQFIQKENQIMRKAKFKKQLTIAILPEHFEQIQEITDEQEISLAEWIRNAVSAALTKKQPKENQMND